MHSGFFGSSHWQSVYVVYVCDIRGDSSVPNLWSRILWFWFISLTTLPQVTCSGILMSFLNIRNDLRWCVSPVDFWHPPGLREGAGRRLPATNSKSCWCCFVFMRMDNSGSEDTKSRSQLFFNSGSDRNSIKDGEQKWVPSDMTTSWQWQSENCFSSLLVLGWCVALSYWSGKCGSPLVGLLLAHTNVVTLLIHLLTKAGLRGTYNLLPDTLWPSKGCGSL